MTVADLDRVWIILEIYERDLPRVEVGAPVSIRVPAVDGVELEGTIGFIYPTLDPTRRVARARVTVANDEGRLRPDMFVEATISTTGVDGVLTIPASAPLYTGNRALVYVATGEAEVGGVYEPREIRIGPRVGDRVVVLDGLHAGEEVVSRGAFRVDAELQIRGEPSMMSPRGDASSGGGHAH